MSSHEDRKSFVIPQSTSLQPESHRKKKKNVLSGPPSSLQPESHRKRGKNVLSGPPSSLQPESHRKTEKTYYPVLPVLYNWNHIERGKKRTIRSSQFFTTGIT